MSEVSKLVFPWVEIEYNEQQLLLLNAKRIPPKYRIHSPIPNPWEVYEGIQNRIIIPVAGMTMQVLMNRNIKVMRSWEDFHKSIWKLVQKLSSIVEDNNPLTIRKIQYILSCLIAIYSLLIKNHPKPASSTIWDEVSIWNEQLMEWFMYNQLILSLFNSINTVNKYLLLQGWDLNDLAIHIRMIIKILQQRMNLSSYEKIILPEDDTLSED